MVSQGDAAFFQQSRAQGSSSHLRCCSLQCRKAERTLSRAESLRLCLSVRGGTSPPTTKQGWVILTCSKVVQPSWNLCYPRQTTHPGAALRAFKWKVHVICIFQAVHTNLALYNLNNHYQYLPSLHSGHGAAHTPEPGTAFCYALINAILVKRHMARSSTTAMRPRAHQMRTNQMSKCFNPPLTSQPVQSPWGVPNFSSTSGGFSWLLDQSSLLRSGIFFNKTEETTCQVTRWSSTIASGLENNQGRRASVFQP